VPTCGRSQRPARTVLHELLRQRRQTAEEFSFDAMDVAREHGLKATLSPRHVQRLAAGRHSDGRPLGPLRPTTQRLLELMLNRPIDELLGPAINDNPSRSDDSVESDELKAALAASQSMDNGLIRLFQQQLDTTRQIDRQLGAAEVIGQLREQISHMTARLAYSLTPNVRQALAAVLVDACTLAGWQSMDQGKYVQAWNYYEQAKVTARESTSTALQAYATAAQAVMLVDVDEHTTAERLINSALDCMDGHTPDILKSWVAGAAGEIHAANGNRDECNRAFDSASHAIRHGAHDPELPFVVLNPTHLARWRGGSLARLGDHQAVELLESALTTLEPSFSRAESAIRLDLAEMLVTDGNGASARAHLDRALQLAAQTESVRLKRRGNRISGQLARP